MGNTIKILKLNQHGSLAITIPKSIANAYAWQAGDELQYKIEKAGTILLSKTINK